MGVQKDVFIREWNAGRLMVRPIGSCKHPGREPGEVCGACGELDRPEDPEYCPECGRLISWSDNGRCDTCENFDPDGEDGFDIMEDE